MEESGREFVHALVTLVSVVCKLDEAATYPDRQGKGEEAVDENGEEENVYLNQQALTCQDEWEVKSVERKLELRHEIRAQSAEWESECDPEDLVGNCFLGEILAVDHCLLGANVRVSRIFPVSVKQTSLV